MAIQIWKSWRVLRTTDKDEQGDFEYEDIMTREETEEKHSHFMSPDPDMRGTPLKPMPSKTYNKDLKRGADKKKLEVEGVSKYEPLV